MHRLDLFNIVSVHTYHDIASDLLLQVVQFISHSIRVLHLHQRGEVVLWFVVLHKRDGGHALYIDILHLRHICDGTDRVVPEKSFQYCKNWKGLDAENQEQA